MIYTHRIGALSALALTLVLGACSTPEDLAAPLLEPQFGTADDDRGVDVATISTGRIYSLSEQSGYIYEDNGDGTSYENGTYTKDILRRYDSSGNQVWSKVVSENLCSWNWDDCQTYKSKSLDIDANGNLYVLNTSSWYSENYHYEFVSHDVTKYDASGNYIKSVSVGGDGGSAGEANLDLSSIDVAIDSNGNIYAAGKKHNFNEDTESGTTIQVVAKYSTTGTLQWQRTSTVGTPTGITVSSSGSVYVVGTKGLARYSNSGGLSWTKTGNFEEVVISGSNLYTRYRKDVRKYDGNGKQLWLKTQSGLSTIVLQKMDGDGSGNVYLSGKYDADSSSNLSMNAMVRKLNSSGSVLWTKTYGTSGAYDDAKGIATITGSEIYTTGLTKGSLAHTNIGGEDGYLRKQSSTGSVVWTR